MGLQDLDADERQPLNDMVAENLKNAIIKKIYRDVDRNVRPDNAFSPVFRQYLLAAGTSFLGFSCGMTAGYSAVLLPQLFDSGFSITKDEASWVASLAALPMMLGCLLSGYPMDRFGRKPAVLASSLLFTIGWVVLGFSYDVIGLYIGRFLTGLSVGLASPMCQVYIAETSDPQHRGILLSAAPLAVAIGILISHVLGTFLHWQTTAFICGVPPLITILSCLMIPESPIWLLGREKKKSADRAYKWFHGADTIEWAKIVAKAKEVSESENISKWSLMLQPSFFKPFFVLLGFFFVQQFSGVNAVAFYSVSILKDVLPNINEYLATIVIDIVRFVVSVGGVILLKKFGRRTLAITSAIGTGVSLFSLSGFLFLNPLQNELTSFNSSMASNGSSLQDEVFLMSSDEEGFNALNCIPLLCLVFYICFVSIGLVPIPWVLTGELFSKQLRGIGSGVTSSFGFVCYFSVVKASPDMFDVWGKAGTFGFFGVISIIGSVMLALCLVETKDKTLLEIEAYYERRPNVVDEERTRY